MEREGRPEEAEAIPAIKNYVKDYVFLNQFVL